MFAVFTNRDAGNELQLQITSTEEVTEPRTFLRIEELAGSPKALKLTDVIYALEGGVKVFLWWDDAAGDTLLLPLEGRGRLDFAAFNGVVNPRNEGWTGHVQISSVGEGSFFLGLEFGKLQN